MTAGAGPARKGVVGRSGPAPTRGAFGALAAVFLAEAAYLFAVVHQPGEAALMAGLGVLVPLAARLVGTAP